MEDYEVRITKLEEALAHALMVNEELSGELLHSNRQISELERKVAMLESRFSSLEDNIEGPVENTKPPHW